MPDREHVVAAVIDAAGGQLIGRVRLQKTVYLLDRLGLNSGFDYDYHHYGPYSRDLENATVDAKAFDLIDEDLQRRASDGAMYSIFRLKGAVSPEVFGNLEPDRSAQLVKQLAKTNVTVLELAATIDWLCHREGEADWRREIKKRKGLKVQGGRLDKAVQLLNDLGLPPPEATAA